VRPQPYHTPADGERRPSRKRRLPKIISAAEARRLLKASATGRGDVGVRDEAMLTLLYRAGLRVSEVTNIKPGDIDSEGVIRLYDAKGGDGTAYFDGKAVWPLIEQWLAIRRGWVGTAFDGPLFCKEGGEKVTVRYIQRLVKRLKAEVGIPEDRKLTPHVLRHTFATELIEEGLPITEVQSAMRHRNLATTAIYLHVRDESLRRKIQSRTQGKEGGT
jgi:site-specific recombinase XerD